MRTRKSALGSLVLTGCIAGMIAGSGLAQDTATGPKRFVTIADAAAMPADQLKELEAFVARNVPLPIRSMSLGVNTSSVDAIVARLKEVRKADDGVVLIAARIPGLSEMVLGAPDSAWAIVNTAALKLDTASKPSIRLGQGTLRALAAATGAGYGLDPKCVNRRVASADDLDRVGGNFSPPTLQAVLFGATERGIAPMAGRKAKAAAKP